MRRSVGIAGSALLALVLLVAATVAFRNPLVALAVRSIASGAGYNVAFERLDVGLSGAVAAGTTVTNRAGEPVFAARRIELHYALTNVLPGSNRRRFGISALDVQRPTLTLIHHADGSYNVALPSGTGSAKPDTAPIDLQVRVRDGSVVLLDRFIVPGHERRQRIVGLAVDAALAPHAHSYYNVRFDLDDGRARYPVTGKATFAADRGFEAQRWTAADLPIGPLVDFALPSHAIDVVDGNLRNIDARIYSFVDPDGTAHPHVALRADLARGEAYIAGVAKPVRDAHGTFIGYDDGLTTAGVDATLAGVPLHLAGGVYDLAAPKLEFALVGRGRLEQLQQAIAPAQRQPLSGRLAFAIRALGSVNAPTVSGQFSAPQLLYRGYPLERAGGTFSLHGQNLDLLGAHFSYGPIAVEAHGSLTLATQVATNLVVTLHGDGDRIPYVPQLLRGLQLTSVVHVEGIGTQLASAGIVYGNARNGSLNAIFDVAANGTGTIGPLTVQRTDGASIYARIALDRPKGTVLGIVDARHVTLLPAALAGLPGVRLAALPPIAGTLDAQLAGGLDNDRLDALSGHVRLSGVRFGAITGSAALDLATASDGTQRGAVTVASSLGTIDGNAGYAGGLVAFDGRLRSSFERLAPLTGNLGAHGTIEGSLRALSNGAASAVQTPALHFADASIRGVPLRDAQATVTFDAGTLDVRALQLGIAGGTVTVRGVLGGGGANGELVATTSALDLRTLAAAGIPLSGGSLLANARVHGSLAAPQANVAALVDAARWRGFAFSGNAFATYGGATLHVNDATVLAFGSYATASGDVRNLTGGTPAIDLGANLRGAQLAPIAAALRLPLRYPDGEFDADLHAAGPATALRIDGTLRIPNGSLNGLDFRAAGVAISGDAHGLTARDGSVMVGTTAIAFSGAAGPAAQQLELRAPHVDLADFDGYFDTAETLAGTGRLSADARLTPASVRATGDLLIQNARYRRYSVGDVGATLHTSGRTIHTDASIHSDHGSAQLTGDATLPAGDPLRDPRHRATLAATGSIAGIDLAQWLPTAGITLPIAGTADGTARLTGTLAAPAFALTAGVTSGVVAGYPLTTATLAANGDAYGAHLDAASVAGPGLSAGATGSFGYGAHDPIALALHVQSDDIALLAKRAGAKLDLAGAFTTTLNASGTRSAPRLAQTLDVTNLKSDNYTLPHAHAELAADPQTLHLLTLEADLTQGRLVASATLPIRLTPAIGVRDEPLTADLRAEGIELAQFADLLPQSSKLAGRIDGHVTASGTPQAPVVNGTLALAGGSYSSNLVRSAFTGVRAQLDFTQTQAQLSGLHANVGGGTFDGSADATFGDLREFERTLAVNGSITANNAAINVANLFRGTINGTVDLRKPQGEIPTLGGTLVFTKTRIPLAALIPKSSAASGERAPRTVNFALNVQAGNDVRVQGPGVDIGARGAIAVGGNLAQPELNGQITSTDGRLSFYRTFVLRSATVAFHPGDGLIPDVDATATTHITNPDTDILLNITGPATNLNLDLASNPSYDKEQILGLLLNAQALGAVPGVETAQGGSSGISVGSLAGGFLGNELTQNLLQPVGSQLGQSLGFQDLALGYNFGSGVSAGARKQLGKNLYASFNQTFGGDDRQAVALNYTLPHNGAVALTFFNAGDQAPSLLATQQLFSPTVQSTNYTLDALQPPPGIAGVVLTYQRKF